GHAIDDVARVGGELRAEALALGAERDEGLDDRPQGHAVVGGRGVADPEVAARDAAVGVTELDEHAGAAGVRAFLAVAEAGLVGVDGDERQLGGAHVTTSSASVSSRYRVRDAPVLGCRAMIASRPLMSVRRSGMTRYSVPRRITITRCCLVTARSSASYC